MLGSLKLQLHFFPPQKTRRGMEQCLFQGLGSPVLPFSILNYLSSTRHIHSTLSSLPSLLFSFHFSALSEQCTKSPSVPMCRSHSGSVWSFICTQSQVQLGLGALDGQLLGPVLTSACGGAILIDSPRKCLKAQHSVWKLWWGCPVADWECCSHSEQLWSWDPLHSHQLP